jgi:hypothetical protein
MGLASMLAYPAREAGAVMHASVGDHLLMHGRIVGQHDRVVEIIEVLGVDGTPPYRVRSQDGHESLMNPGPDSVVQHRDAADPDS